MADRTTDYLEILETALEAARQAGKFLQDTFADRPKVEYKGELDLVTERDRKSQEMIYQHIKNKYPGHSILGEENLNIEKDDSLLWLIDPLDGTTNYAHSFPLFSVSIAFLENKKIKAGVVYVPMLDEMFRAIAGSGAFLNDKKISVSDKTDIGTAMLSTGFPYDLRESKINNIDIFSRMIYRARAIRRTGSAAIDLAYVACGRFDGFWELKLSPWDTAAGALLVTEAGGKTSDFSGQPFDPFVKECLATNGPIHEPMLEVLMNHQTGKA